MCHNMEQSMWRGLPCFTDRVNVWLLPTEDLSTVNGKAIFDKLPEKRRQKISNCKILEKKKQSFGAGVLLFLLCQLLQERYGFTEKELEIQYMPMGKPVFSRQVGASFSLSHTHGCAAIAFALPDFVFRKNQQLGMDIELIRECRMAVAKRFFTKEEYDYIFFQQENQQDAFFLIWTGKEAVMKKGGEGLKMPLSSFSVLQQKKKDLFYTSFECGDRKYAMTICMDEAMSSYEPFLSWVDCAIL